MEIPVVAAVTMLPDVSVVIPTHDRGPLLTLTLRSVLQQQDVRLEIVVVDDGSTDDTAERVAALADERITLLRNERSQGVSAARNRGVATARGRWIAFLDDDDLWAPTKLSAQLDAVVEAGAPWVYTGTVKIDGAGRITGSQPLPSPEDVMRTLRRSNPVPGGCSGVMTDREALDTVGGFDTRLINLADWDLWIRLGRVGAPACVPAPLVAYRLHPGQASLDVELIVSELKRIRRKHGLRVDRGQFEFYLAHKCLLGGRRRDAMRHFLLAALHGDARAVTDAGLTTLRASAARRIPSLARRPRMSDPWLAQASGWVAALSSSSAANVVPPPT